jgi:hypothetical protein
MSDSSKPARPRRDETTDDDAAELSDDETFDEPRQPPRLSREEIERIREEQELEDFMEEPTEGSLSIISDTDVPGAPG